MKEAESLPEQLAPSEIRYESGGAVAEIFNSLTHAIGAGLAIGALIVLLILAGEQPSFAKYVAFSVYGASQILLFLSSALMHSFAALPRVRYSLRIIDQAFVYLMIAGTYTPVSIVAMRGVWGWTVFGVIWALAAVGIVLKTAVFRERHLLTDLLYVPMGWFIFVALRPLIESTSPGFRVWLFTGGGCYTVGVLFYAWKRLPFSHTVWHLFVLAGSICFMIAYILHMV